MKETFVFLKGWDPTVPPAAPMKVRTSETPAHAFRISKFMITR